MPVSEKRVLGHIGQVEYFKERARLRASALVGDLDASDVLADPSGYVEDVAAAILRMLEPDLEALAEEAADYARELGLAEIEELELEGIVQDARDDVAVLLIPALLAALTPALENLRKQLDGGVSIEVLEANLAAAASKAAVFRTFIATARSQSAGLIGGIARAVMGKALELAREGQAADPELLEVEEPGEARFEWLTVGDNKVCRDTFANSCDPRHGQVLSWDEWVEVGTPDVPSRLCEDRCRCELVPEGAGIPEKINPAETVAEAKERARREAGQ